MTHTSCNCAALREATRFVTRAYDEALAPVGLGINQYSILARLERLGPTGQQELARALVMDRSTLGHLIRPLEARQLVAITKKARDARCRVIAVTDAGRTLLAEARPLWAGAQARFEDAVGAPEAGALRDALTALLALPPAALRSEISPRTGP